MSTQTNTRRLSTVQCSTVQFGRVHHNTSLQCAKTSEVVISCCVFPRLTLFQGLLCSALLCTDDTCKILYCTVLYPARTRRLVRAGPLPALQPLRASEPCSRFRPVGAETTMLPRHLRSPASSRPSIQLNAGSPVVGLDETRQC